MEMFKIIKRGFQGSLIGIANLMPGVSGGTIVLLMGIYERLIYAINTIPFYDFLLLIKGKKVEMFKSIKEIDFLFLIPLFFGMIFSTIIFAKILGHLLYSFPAYTNSFLFGLIMSSALTLYHRVEIFDKFSLFACIIGFFSAFIIVGLPSLQTNHSLIIVFIAGALSLMSMLLPGLSGALVLIIMNQYEYLLNSLNDLDLTVISVFMMGGITGILSLAKGIEILFKKHRAATLFFLFGLILGSLRVPVTEGFAADPSLIEWLIPAAVGSLLISSLELIYVKVFN